MLRAIFLSIGIVIYAIFFATFLYLIGFVGDLPLLPVTVDRGGAIGVPALAAAIDVALIGLFGVQHSVMARPAFKRGWTRIVPEPLERSVYVLAASLVLMVMFAAWRPIPVTVWQVDRPVVAAMLYGLSGLGWGIVLLSTFLISHFELFGLSQAWAYLRRRPRGAPVFRTPLLYRHVRHPLYSGFIIAFWATPYMTVGHLLLAAVMTGYIVIAIGFEERDLTVIFGARYAEYRGRVGMLAPRFGARNG